MAGKPRPMSQVKQLIRLHLQGNGKKTIARELGISKNTVKQYLEKAAADPLSIKELLELDDPVLEGRFHAGNPAYKDLRFEDLKRRLPYLEKELEKVGVNKMLLWEEYKQAYPAGYGRTQFFFHFAQLSRARKPSAVLTHKPGDKLYIDFSGKKVHYTDRETGEMIVCELFVACLPFSDYAFCIAVPSQRLNDFIYALIRCLEALGGAAQALVPDNMKTAVTRADRYEPTINQTLEDLANHYQMTVVPARPRKPKDKSLAENQVKLIYTRVLAKLRNRQFFDLDSLNTAITEKIREHNQTRRQQKPYTREEEFLAAEKDQLTPLPDKRFELKYYAELKVAQNGHVYLGRDKHYYSVPYTYIGSKVKVIYTRMLVRIYAQGKQIALHQRNYAPGKYTSVKEHLCSQHQHYHNRSPAYYLDRARHTCRELYDLLEALFGQNRYPEQLYNTCDGLFSLARRSDPGRFARACQIAAEHRVYSYKFVQSILENNMTELEQDRPMDHPLPGGSNVRGKDYYQQLTLTLKTPS
ncbi:transposase [Anseongella ginsenosidimutans]|uniref:Transposase n=2 Tax=Anseongella ginsenosidimutans TaxID=496056 RepID=A0A4R3KLE6_9SPHI|nr:IS21 family transposase [Anseongella ginsenosidimutans]TCS83634.1 transposase [Anseongella ginsenosidimutans]